MCAGERRPQKPFFNFLTPLGLDITLTATVNESAERSWWKGEKWDHYSRVTGSRAGLSSHHKNPFILFNQTLSRLASFVHKLFCVEEGEWSAVLRNAIKLYSTFMIGALSFQSLLDNNTFII